MTRLVGDQALWQQLVAAIPAPPPDMREHVDRLIAMYDAAKAAPSPEPCAPAVPLQRRLHFLQVQRDSASSGEPEIAGVKMLLQIHDELVFEAPESCADEVKSLVVDRMESAMTLSVPLVADASIATNWFEGK